MNLTTIENALHSWAETYLGISCVFANQNGGALNPPFAMLQVTVIPFSGHDELLPVATSGIGVYKGNRELTLAVQVFGDGAYQKAIDLRESLEREASRASLAASGVVFVDSLNISDTTELLDTGFEARASLDILFRVSSEHSEDVGVIEQVDLTDTYKDQDETTIITGNTIIGA